VTRGEGVCWREGEIPVFPTLEEQGEEYIGNRQTWGKNSQREGTWVGCGGVRDNMIL